MTLALGPSPYAAPPGWDHDCRCPGCWRPVTGRRPAFAMAAPFPDDLVGWEAYAARCHGENGEIAREHLLRLGWLACGACNGVGRGEPCALHDEGPAPPVRDGVAYCDRCDGCGLEPPPAPFVVAPAPPDPFLAQLLHRTRPITVQ